MKIALIIPENGKKDEKSFYDIKFVSSFVFSKKYFSYLLAIPTLISLTPPEHEIKVFDENIEEIDYDWGADLVGITIRTMYATRAYEISDAYRKRGVKTVVGGIHPSFCADEAKEHADCVVVGEAEGIWGRLLKDFESGEMEAVYRASEKTDLAVSPMPKRSFVSTNRYFADIVQTTKGCPFVCEFCSVYSFDGQKIRNRPVEKVVRELKTLDGKVGGIKKKSIFFADDNIIANKKYARQLFEALVPLKINWSCQASINISKEDEILRLMKKGGCGAILVGFETVSKKNLVHMDKEINLKYEYHEAIEKIQSYGILVHGSFILGNDCDDISSFDELSDFVDKTKLLMPLINILTPFPGTNLHSRLEKDGRILHENWSMYDARNVVFTPVLMSVEELTDGFRKVLQNVYSFKNIFKRLSYFWGIDFWKHSNEIDPIAFKYRLLFALRLLTYLRPGKGERNKFIIKILPKVFDRRVRVSTILTLMAYNDFAYSL